MKESEFTKPTTGKIDLDAANVKQLREEALLAIMRGDSARMREIDQRLRAIDALQSRFKNVLGDVKANKD